MSPSFYIAGVCILAGLIGLIAEMVWVCRKAYERGKEQGFHDAYLSWTEMGRQVEEAQKENWRSEPKKGMWP
jgi:hypothetical protein